MVDTAQHRALAHDAALQGFVLLKNDGHTLPLTRNARIAVLGPHAQSTIALLGNYHERTPPFCVSPCAGMGAAAVAPDHVTCVVPAGCSIGGNATCFDSAAAVAVKNADVTVLVLGLDQSQEAEGHDRRNLSLPGTQLDLVAKVTATAGGKPVVVLLASGSALDVAVLQRDAAVGAIAWVGYPGEASGEAIASAVFGDTNKWGKLPMTWYDGSFCDDVNLSDYRMRPDAATGYP